MMGADRPTLHDDFAAARGVQPECPGAVGLDRGILDLDPPTELGQQRGGRRRLRMVALDTDGRAIDVHGTAGMFGYHSVASVAGRVGAPFRRDRTAIQRDRRFAVATLILREDAEPTRTACRNIGAADDTATV